MVSCLIGSPWRRPTLGGEVAIDAVSECMTKPGNSRLSAARPSTPGVLTRRSFLVCLAGLLPACSSRHPRIEFTRVPPADKGGPDAMDIIAGRVTGAKPGQQIIVFAHSEVWWAEPRMGRLLIEIQPDSTWTTQTHFGTEYAAALVDLGYQPSLTSAELPKEGGYVVAVAVVPGVSPSREVHRTLRFSGYDWTVRAAPSNRGGNNAYDPSNAWIDEWGAAPDRPLQAKKHKCELARRDLIRPSESGVDLRMKVSVITLRLSKPTAILPNLASLRAERESHRTWNRGGADVQGVGSNDGRCWPWRALYSFLRFFHILTRAQPMRGACPSLCKCENLDTESKCLLYSG